MSNSRDASHLHQHLVDLAALANRSQFAVKRGKKYEKISRMLTDADITAHLTTASSASIYPLVGNYTQIGVFDVDDHEELAGWKSVESYTQRITNALDSRSVHYAVYRSGGGQGIHVWVLWRSPQPANLARRFLTQIREEVVLSGTSENWEHVVCELFPKQDAGGEKGGNCISLPFSRLSAFLRCNAARAIDDDVNTSPSVSQLMNVDIQPANLPAVIKQKTYPSTRKSRPSINTINSLLNQIPASDRDDWIACGMALKAELGEEGYDHWLAWSKTSEAFKNEADCLYTWKSFTAGGKVGIGTVFYLAKSNGWRPDLQGEVEEMNTRFGILACGNRTMIIDKAPAWNMDDPIVLLGTRPFKDRMFEESADLLFGTGQPPNKGEGWFEHPLAARYVGVDFNPSKLPGDDGKVWNMWRGFPVEAKPGDWSLLKEHIFDNVANGDVEMGDWLMNWMALSVQQPADLIGTAPVLKGAPGTGKSFLAKMFARLWTPHEITITHQDQVAGKFNSFLMGKRFVFIDEGGFGDDRRSAGTLKTRLTEGKIMLERKGVDAIRIENRMIFMVASNEDAIIPADLGDRRWMMFTVGSGRRGDHEFFAAAQKQMENGGTEAMLHELLNRNMEMGPNPKMIIKNDDLFYQIVGKRHADLRYIHQLLDFGVLPGSTPNAPSQTTTSHLWQGMQEAEPESRQFSSAGLGKKIAEIFGDITAGQREVPGIGRNGSKPRSKVYDFPPLAVSRAQYEKFVKTRAPWTLHTTTWTSDEEGTPF